MFTRKHVTTVVALLGLVVLPALLRAENEPGAVYTQNNSPAGNRVMAFTRDSKGALQSSGSFPTGGTGTGAGLGSQGAVTLSDDGRHLLAVNAGSNELSVFVVHHGDLSLTDKVPSGGVRPISVSIDKNLVYVLNAGGAAGSQDNVAGFYLTPDGRLLGLPGSARALSAANAGPAQVSFSPSGDHLVVTEKATNVVTTFAVDADGFAGAAHATASSGTTPFGFAFTPAGTLVVSEAAGGAPAGSSLSSYRINGANLLTSITASLSTGQTAACWVAVAKNGKYGYATNAGSNTVTGVEIATDGTLSLLQAGGASAPTGMSPTDVAVSNNSRFLSVLNSRSRSISQYRIESDGTLTPLGAFGDLPAGTVGLAAR